jgi:hypothetical protein
MLSHHQAMSPATTGEIQNALARRQSATAL